MSASIRRTPDTRSLTDYAVWLLARREYTAAELTAKFRTRFVEQAELFAAVIAKLQTLGMQSDERAARMFLETHAGWGQARVKMALSRRGIAPTVLAAVLAESAPDELARAREVLALKLRGAPLPHDYAARQKLAGFLARRGFSLTIVRCVLALATESD